MLGLECSSLYAADMKDDSHRRRLEICEIWTWRTMEKISWIDYDEAELHGG